MYVILTFQLQGILICMSMVIFLLIIAFVFQIMFIIRKFSLIKSRFGFQVLKNAPPFYRFENIKKLRFCLKTDVLLTKLQN